MLLLFTLLACDGPKDADSAPPPPIQRDELDLSTCEDVDGDATREPHSEDCSEAGGVCSFSRAACEGSERELEHDADCRFDDGSEGYCCVPPAAAEEGDTCASLGGLCTTEVGCGYVDGWQAPATDCPVETVCCTPALTCSGFGIATCCAEDGSTADRPACERGELVCVNEDLLLKCEQDCPADDR